MKLPASLPSPLRKRPEPEPPTRRPWRMSMAICSASSPIWLLVFDIKLLHQAIQFGHLAQPINSGSHAFLVNRDDSLGIALGIGRTLTLGAWLDLTVSLAHQDQVHPHPVRQSTQPGPQPSGICQFDRHDWGSYRRPAWHRGWRHPPRG